MQDPVLQVNNLVKQYKQLTAVDNVSFSVPKGSCFGMLGPNGAGKTTTVEMMEGIRRATSGEILYQNQPISPDFKSEIGIQFQSTALPDFIKVREVLDLFQGFYRRKAPLDEVIEMCSLHDIINRDVKKLSGGQRQRVLLAVALVNDPSILFLDEPTTGLDPQARRNFWALIEKIRTKNSTIVLTTHYMEEAYLLCDYLLIMDKGSVVAEGTPSALLRKHHDASKIIIPEEDLGSALDNSPWQTSRTKEGMVVRTNDMDKTLAYLISKEVTLANIEVKPQTLEDLFLELTGRQLRE